MIVEPDLRIPDFVKAGADIISVHAEQASTIHLHRSIGQVQTVPLHLLGLPYRAGNSGTRAPKLTWSHEYV